MISATLLAVLTPSLLTIAEVIEKEPSMAGELVLRGEQHKTVVAVEQVEEDMFPPNFTQLHLVEEASMSGNRCERKRWTATFQGLPGDDSAAEVLTGAYSVTEITISDADICPSDGYAHLDPSVDAQQGFAALVVLDELRSGSVKVEFECADQISSDLCSSPETIRDELTRLSPWAISRAEGDLELWLGTPGQVITAVRINPTKPQRARIERRIPAPF